MINRITLQIFIGLNLIMVIGFILQKNTNYYIDNDVIKDPKLYYKNYTPNPSDLIISRSDYANKFYGFWLGQCIANWTG